MMDIITNPKMNNIYSFTYEIMEKREYPEYYDNEVFNTFVKEMKDRNILVMPFLSNHWVRSKGRAAIKNSEKLAIQILKTEI